MKLITLKQLLSITESNLPILIKTTFTEQTVYSGLSNLINDITSNNNVDLNAKVKLIKSRDTTLIIYI